MNLSSIGKPLFKIAIIAKNALVDTLDKLLGNFGGFFIGVLTSPFAAIYFEYCFINFAVNDPIDEGPLAIRILMSMIFTFLGLLYIPVIMLATTLFCAYYGYKGGHKELGNITAYLFHKITKIYPSPHPFKKQDVNNSLMLGDMLETSKEFLFEGVKGIQKFQEFKKTKSLFSILIRNTEEKHLSSLAQRLVEAEESEEISLSNLLKNFLNDNKAKRNKLFFAILEYCQEKNSEKYQDYLIKIITLVQTSWFDWRKEEQLQSFFHHYLIYKMELIKKDSSKTSSQSEGISQFVVAVYKANKLDNLIKASINFANSLKNEKKLSEGKDLIYFLIASVENLDPGKLLEFYQEYIKLFNENDLNNLINSKDLKETEKEDQKEKEKEITEDIEIEADNHTELTVLNQAYYHLALAKHQKFSELWMVFGENKDVDVNEEQVKAAHNEFLDYYKPLKKIATVLGETNDLWVFAAGFKAVSSSGNEFELELNKSEIQKYLNENMISEKDSKKFKLNQEEKEKIENSTNEIEYIEEASASSDPNPTSWKSSQPSGFAYLIAQFGHYAQPAFSAVDQLMIDTGRCARDLTKSFLNRI